MSKPATKAQRPPAATERPVVGPTVIIVFALALAGVLWIYERDSLPLVGIGMLPTAGAALASRNHKGIWITVGWLDFAGLSYWLMDLWASDQQAGQTAAQMNTIAPILTAYVASLGGWILYMAMPSVTRVFIAASLRRRKTRLQAKQKKLVDRWDRGIMRR
jgi:hypothetical protein